MITPYRLLLCGVLLIASPALVDADVIFVPADYSTIQEAVDHASDGDAVMVSQGLYPEIVSVMAKRIEIVGVDGPAVTTVDAVCWRNPIPIAGVGGGLTGFAVKDSLVLDGISALFTASDVTVNGDTRAEVLPPTIDPDGFVTLSASRLHGVVDIAQGNWFSGARLEACEVDGPLLRIDSESGLTITGCEVSGSDVDLFGEFVTISANTFDGCNFVLRVDSGSGQVTGNRVIGGTGLVVEGTSLGHVDVIDNVVSDATFGVHHTNDVTTMVDRGNRITRCDTGIVYRGSMVLAERNTIWSCGVGIDVVASFQAQLLHNTVTGSIDDGILLQDSGPVPDVTLRGNLVVANGRGIAVLAADALTNECNDVWSNTMADWVGVANPMGTDGNIAVDPLFCQVEADNFALAMGSPCRPGNHPDGADCDVIGANEADCIVVGVEETASSQAPRGVAVRPNPTGTVVRFEIPELARDADRRLSIFDVSGRRVATLPCSAAVHTVIWATGDVGVAAGVYYAVLEGVGVSSPPTRFVILQ